MPSPTRTSAPAHPTRLHASSAVPPTHPRPRSAASPSGSPFPASSLPPTPPSTASPRSSPFRSPDGALTAAAALPQSPASAYTPPPRSAADALLVLPEGEELYPALSSPPVLITPSQSHSSLPRTSRDPRGQSLPESDVQTLPEAGDAHRFSSHLSIDTRASSSIAMPPHASPYASPPLVSSPTLTPAYGSDDGHAYQHRTRRHRRPQLSPNLSTSHTASSDGTPASSTSSSAHPSPLAAHLTLLAAGSARPPQSPPSAPPLCEFCGKEAAEWYCCQCALGMCERHREEGHARLYPTSGGHQLLELSGHKQGQEKRRREREEAERCEQASRLQRDETRQSKRQQLMRTDSATLSPFAGLQSLPATAAEEVLRAKIEQNLRHIAEQRNEEEALMAAAKKADGRTSAGSGRDGHGRAGGRKVRVLDTPSITHRFVPLITKQDVVDNWSRLMEDVAHLYPKPKPKGSGRRSRPSVHHTHMLDVAASSPSAVLPPQHETNSVHLGHILPIASRLGGRSVSAVSPSQRRSAIARISCTPSPPLSPLRWKAEDDERDRRTKQQAEAEAEHARQAEEWRQLQHRTRRASRELNGYRQAEDSSSHSRHHSLPHTDRHALDDSTVSPHSSTSSARSSSLRQPLTSTRLPDEQLVFTRLPPPPPADRARSRSSPPRQLGQLELLGSMQRSQRHRRRMQQQREEDGDQEEDDVERGQQRDDEALDEEVPEDIEEEEEDRDEDDGSAAMDDRQFLPAPPALLLPPATSSHKHDLDFSADEVFHEEAANHDEEEDEEEEEEGVGEAHESEQRSVEWSGYNDSLQQRRSDSQDEEPYSEQYDEEQDEDNQAAAHSTFLSDGQLVAQWKRATEQHWEQRPASDSQHIQHAQQPQYRSTATQTDEQRMVREEVKLHSADECDDDKEEESLDGHVEEDAGGVFVQVTPLRDRRDEQAQDRTPYAHTHMHRTPLASAQQASDDDSGDEQQLDEDDDEEGNQQREEGTDDEGEEHGDEEDDNSDTHSARNGSLSSDERDGSENAAEPLSQVSLSPRRSPASSFEWHDHDLNDAMWRSSTDSPQRSASQRKAADALQLLPSPFHTANKPSLVPLAQRHHSNSALSASQVDKDVLLLAQALQRILNKRDGRPAYPALPAFSRLSELDQSHRSAPTASASATSSSSHRRRVSDVSAASSNSRVPLPPHAYPRSSPPVYPVSHSHSHSQQLPQSHGQQPLDQRPAASTSSSSQSSTSRRERLHSSSHRSRHSHTEPAARSLLGSPPASAPSRLTPAADRVDSNTAAPHSRQSSLPSSLLSLDLSHGALRRLDKLLASHNAHKPPLSSTAHQQQADRDRVADGSAVEQHRPRIVQSSASAITVQLKATHSLSILASMEHHNHNHRAGQHADHTSRHKPLTVAPHQQHRQHKQQQQQPRHGHRPLSKKEAVSLASRAYQSMRAGESNGSRSAWHD